jgi:hypothetical protein
MGLGLGVGLDCSVHDRGLRRHCLRGVEVVAGACCEGCECCNELFGIERRIFERSETVPSGWPASHFIAP